MLKYVTANLGLIHTKLDDAIQLQHLIRHPGINANPMNYTEYVALDGANNITESFSINKQRTESKKCSF